MLSVSASMTCSRCDSENSAERSQCWRCGQPLSAPPASEPKAAAPRVRARVVVPLCIIAALILLGSAYARWRASHAGEVASDTQAASAQDEKRVTDALDR